MSTTAAELPGTRGLPWKWLIWLPVLASVIAGFTMLAVALRYADQPLPETITRTGPVQYGEHLGVARARALGLLGEARIDPLAHAIALSLRGSELPASVSLRLWHPTRAERDQSLTLVRGNDGLYRGAWPDRAQDLTPLLGAPGWELPGRFDRSGERILFHP